MAILGNVHVLFYSFLIPAWSQAMPLFEEVFLFREQVKTTRRFVHRGMVASGTISE